MDSFFSRLHQQQQYQIQQQQQYQIQQQQYQLEQKIPITPRPLQGPRPTPLSVRKDSYKIKKPPAAPVPAGHTRPQRQPPQQQRQPVIIYTVSPKVIHIKPGDFRSLVQHLTGVNSSPSTAAIAAATGINPISPAGFPSPSGGMSPAAKLATIEKAQHPTDHTVHAGMSRELAEELDIVGPYDTGGPSSAAQSNFLGVLSPNPASLPGISPNLFSTAPELNSLGFLDMISLSPAVAINKNFVDNSFLHSPNFPFTPFSPFPPNWDLFGEF